MKRSNLSNSIEELDIIMPVDSEEEALKQILKLRQDRVVHILDLSMGRLDLPSTMEQKYESIYAKKYWDVRWIDAHDFAASVADPSRIAYLKWIGERSNSTDIGNRSIKEWFTFREELSLWWLSEISIKDVYSRIYPRWIFYAVFVLKRLQSMGFTTQRASIWGSDVRACSSMKVASEHILSCSAKVKEISVANPAESTGTFLGRLKGLIRSSELLILARSFLTDILELFRQLTFSRNNIEPLEGEGKIYPKSKREPLAIVFTRFPHSWQIDYSPYGDVKNKLNDHYLADLPERLRKQDINVMWCPDIQQHNNNLKIWLNRRSQKTIPDTLRWMSIEWPDVLCGIWYSFKWRVKYLWLFKVLRLGRHWHYDGVPLGEWLKQDYFYLCSGGALRDTLDMLRYRKAFEAVNPDVILYRSEFYSSGRKVAAAASERAKLIAVQHGILLREDTAYQCCPGDIQKRNAFQDRRDHVHYLPAPDTYAAFGEVSVDYFKEHGDFPHSRVKPVGGVRHDRLVEDYMFPKDRQRDKRLKIRKVLGLPINEKIILVCTNGAESAIKLLSLTAGAMRITGTTAMLAIKQHHYHLSAETIHSMADKLKIGEYNVYDKYIYPLIFASDLVITGLSTVAVESYLLETHVIVVSARQDYQLYPLSTEGIGQVVTSKESMGTALRHVFDQKPRIGEPLSLDKVLKNGDAKACIRLANLICEVCS